MKGLLSLQIVAEQQKNELRIGDLNSIGLQSSMQRTTRALSRALERLSSGKRAPNFRDDPALSSMTTKLDSQIRGLHQSVLNSQDQIAQTQNQETGIDAQINIVQRMRDIALEASNSSLQSSERENLQSELMQLLNEFGRINKDSIYNGSPTLQGSLNTSIASSFTQDVGTMRFDSKVSTQSVNDSGSNGLLLADLNGDGIKDILQLGGYAELGKLSGGFGPSYLALTDTPGVVTTDIKVADLTGDGIVDLLYVGKNQSHIAVGRGDGTFSTTTTLDASAGRYADVGDLNSDGNLDIVFSDNANMTAMIFLGDGAGNFSYSTSYAAYGTGGFVDSDIRDLDLVDINQDGKLDLIESVESFNLGSYMMAVYRLGTGTGSFGAPTTIHQGSGVAIYDFGDINLDGRMDLAVSDGAVMNTWLGSATGAPSFASSFAMTASANFDLVDFNNDGLLDIISDFGGIAQNIGGGRFSSSFQSFTPTGPSNIYSDVNKDGVMDLINFDGSLQFRIQQKTNRSVVEKLNIQNTAKATELVGILDKTLQGLETKLSSASALHSRLDYQSASQTLLSEALIDAKEGMSSADLVLETAEVLRLQILQQAQIAVQAQANSSMSMVIALLNPSR